ncbi:MAG: amidase [Candidatus Rokubacteria bacterium]|nr:amidase [Candidatus Rokubacteria bacterium]
MTPLHALTATEAVAAIRNGQLSAVSLVEALLARIDALDPDVKAWVTVDRGGALETASQRDREAQAGRLRGPLHGLPVGLKDIYHVAGMVTTCGAGPFAHEHPADDAETVGRLRQAGAVVLGKTATTEFAYLDPAETRNPWNPEHTPGGSSSGSAAAVAARMVPLALGSQTVGSTLRPAAYCGVVGLKPTHGRVSCRGVVPLAWSLDHVGIFSRSVTDAALGLQVLAGHDPRDPFSSRESLADYVGALSRAERPPRLALPRQFFLERASPEVAAHLEGVAQSLGRGGATVEEIKLPPSFEGIHDAGARVVRVEAAAFHAARFATHAAQYRPKLRALIEAGPTISAVEYVAAQQHRRRFRDEMAASFERADALLMPVAGAPAPKGLDSTGDPAFCAPWSFAGLPAISLPSGLTMDGLPLAVQLVSAAFDEPRLLAVARWCEAQLGFTAAPPETVRRSV